ncbi:RNA 2',3'-cyclic phosphodiesterase [Cytophagaceae bacterium ABcell3]|nr:RNA 2',3'-cyclic phosphodiesterase [Cytophagaceae bacterium ABcell3]
MGAKRLFVAIPVPDIVKDEIRSVAEKLGEMDKIIPEQNWHITVHFLGDTPEKEIPSLLEKLSHGVADIPAFTLSFQDIIVKKSGFRAMIWVRGEPSQAFVKLVRKVEMLTDGKEQRKPIPHITLSRIKKKPFERKNLPVAFKSSLTWKVEHIELWESKLSRENSLYTNLGSFKLKDYEPKYR